MQEHIRLLREKISPPRQRGPVLSEDEQDEIRNLHAKGLGAAEIGRRIGRPSGTVSSWLRRQRGGA
jgi:IS30 family transposase